MRVIAKVTTFGDSGRRLLDSIGEAAWQVFPLLKTHLDASPREQARVEQLMLGNRYLARREKREPWLPGNRPRSCQHIAMPSMPPPNTQW